MWCNFYFYQPKDQKENKYHNRPKMDSLFIFLIPTIHKRGEMVTIHMTISLAHDDVI